MSAVYMLVYILRDMDLSFIVLLFSITSHRGAILSGDIEIVDELSCMTGISMAPIPVVVLRGYRMIAIRNSKTMLVRTLRTAIIARARIGAKQHIIRRHIIRRKYYRPPPPVIGAILFSPLVPIEKTKILFLLYMFV